MKYMTFYSVLLILSSSGFSQRFENNPLVHTYSIVAVDSITGDIGAAVQSHWFSVGSNVIWAEAGVGAVATQSFINPAYGPQGLALMKEGKGPDEALNIMLSEDAGKEFRQVALIDAKGRSKAHTGSFCIEEAGHVFGRYFSAQANLMLTNTVWAAMESSFKKTRSPLAERLIAALEAAENEGGDIRGRQSAAILVVRAQSTGKIWEDRLVDLRVEDHPEAVAEIKRLLKIHRAYEHMNAGDVAIEKGDEAAALREYAAAEKLQPENLEMKYWHAVSLVNIGDLQKALPLFKEVFSGNPNWKTLTPRLLKNDILKVNEDGLKKILHQ